ncbi:MAG: PilT/PilU family type 4a pilus ATPase [Acidobacteriota bacterium]|nr:PilT/PilU family type 4a pilus ATPase [Acidobacteriota bacterium]
MSVASVDPTSAPRDIDTLLRQMTEMGASDLHLRPARTPLIRLHGRLQPLEGEPLKAAEIGAMMDTIMQPHHKAKFEKNLSVDLGYGIAGLARFRCNVFLQRGTLAAAFRMIPDMIAQVQDLELPESLLDFAHLPMGLVLVTGPTGSGKSTTLAALVQYITDNFPLHVVTIEDPIEFLLHEEVGTVSQREVGTDTPVFFEALKNSLRQDPDVILVGEMRDPETVSTAISAAETGHLVFSTLHTNNASQTIDRILDNFPPGQQTQVRFQMSQVLKGVISMQLIRREDGSGRIGALEILRSSPEVEKLIATGRTEELLERIESSVAGLKMQSMNQSLVALLVHGTISCDEAMRRSTDPDDLDLKLRSLFPRLAEQESSMSTSSADFSQIFELLQFRKLYEEQDEQLKIQLAEKDEVVAELRQRLEHPGEELGRIRGSVGENASSWPRSRQNATALRSRRASGSTSSRSASERSTSSSRRRRSDRNLLCQAPASGCGWVTTR